MTCRTAATNCTYLLLEQLGGPGKTRLENISKSTQAPSKFKPTQISQKCNNINVLCLGQFSGRVSPESAASSSGARQDLKRNEAGLIFLVRAAKETSAEISRYGAFSVESEYKGRYKDESQMEPMIDSQKSSRLHGFTASRP